MTEFKETVKVVCISDTHGLHKSMEKKLPAGDMIIHAGDCTNVGELGQIAMFFDWYAELPYKHKILIAGNHDFGFQDRFNDVQKFLEGRGITYLQDSCAAIEGVKIFGSPWTLAFQNWAFMTNETGLEEVYRKQISQEGSPDIIVTHSPLKGFLDSTVTEGEHLGCNALLTPIRLHFPQYVIHGHIHGGYGKHKLNKQTTLINASICNEAYDPVNKPIVIEVIKNKDLKKENKKLRELFKKTLSACKARSRQ
ncbi:MAG: hypothetical protein A2452_03755 [Candidatus Firestonebacteria bacterium RIFOXYC2_FULL_39_67]|nr:MAG: hypothetical protein A2536_08490 [Candidatus Firestonebacteria bacterium RIFOXYD2_FULL_39_29]OGF54390.1 MAG: hypothetical protein A2497_05695 [Candidatus Firestonebacteria bacterium RifOxyC12_full_39_7]OGF54683.1 MAG: hypothetical protein A2452_03755 [Candidatus Firestonebacteria bacterium RIFOXYC2_FULL_39_67]